MKIEIRADGAHISGYVNVVERKSRPVITPHGKVIEEIEAVIQIVAALLLMLIGLPGTCKKKKTSKQKPRKALCIKALRGFVLNVVTYSNPKCTPSRPFVTKFGISLKGVHPLIPIPMEM